ncbi:histidine kinase [uncultured Bacteroides sp.]|uniref:sensor histidine kinase n=1 Tax=uncultured Bacteroides sp. TaxID=162156 RepID=UPI00280B5C58|nr:histidine kinase [uncultured Bacteroides sp.]
MKDSKIIYNWGKSLVDHQFRLLGHLLLLVLILFLGFQNIHGSFNSDGFLYAFVVSTLIFALPIYLSIYWLVPRFLNKHQLAHYWFWFSVIILLSVLLGLVFLYPLHQRYGIDDFHLQDGRPFSFLSFMHSVVTLMLIASGCTSFELFRRWIISGKEIMELEKATKQTELQQLKNQINPHFLFNMLNNANILVKENAVEASQILAKLDDLLCYQFNDSARKEVFLQADIQFLVDYLELEKVRRDCFEYHVTTEGELDEVCVPPLLFIPFVENAVKHNPDSNNLSYVHLYFKVRDNKLLFRCENSKPPVPVKKEGGIGLVNIRRRLDLLYGLRYVLEIEDKETTYNVNLHLSL